MISQVQIKSIDQLLNKRQQVINNPALPVGIPDAAAYYYVRQASFLSKKQQKWSYYFFQGLNVNPQNLSIFLRDQVTRENKNNKQKLCRGVFAIYDLFSRSDIIIEINIPGNLRIYKVINDKKQLVSNQQIDLMYISSCLRAMYQNSLSWGRFFILFHDSKNYINELKNFFTIYFRIALKRQISLGNQYQGQASVKGSHSCSLIVNYVKQRKLTKQSIQIIQALFQKNKEYRQCNKYAVLLAQLYLQQGKASKSLQIISELIKNSKQPFLLYIQANYLLAAHLPKEALYVANSIVSLNQFQIWIILANIHIVLSHFADALVCLNHASKLSKIKSNKAHDTHYKQFLDLGKTKLCGVLDGIQNCPRLLIANQTPLSILVKEVQQKNRFLLQKGFWRLNCLQKIVYKCIQQIKYKIQIKQFQQLLMSTFQDSPPNFPIVHLRKHSTTNQIIEDNMTNRVLPQHQKQNQQIEDLPDFLKESTQKVQQTGGGKPSRNLSIIQQIQSIIENSNYEQKQKQRGSGKIQLRRQVNQTLFKIIQMVMSQTEFDRAEHEGNYAKLLQTYSRMRTCSVWNNYYIDKLFKVLMYMANYKTIVVLVGETLDFLQQRGVKKIDKLPYWMHKYVFFIIEEKGLRFLNDMLEKMKFYDEAVIDTIQIAKKWKMKGVMY